MECLSEKRNGGKHGNIIYTTFNGLHQIYFPTKIIETVALQTNDLLLVSVYIPPERNAIKDIENMLQQVELTVSRNQIKWIVVIGDFNLSFQQLSNVEQMMRRYDLSQLVSEPTHELGAIIDVAFTNIKDVSVRNLPVWFSDHHAISYSQFLMESELLIISLVFCVFCFFGFSCSCCVGLCFPCFVFVCGF
jgi:hypothetical protein